MNQEKFLVKPGGNITYGRGCRRDAFHITFNKNATTNRVTLPFERKQSNDPYGYIYIINDQKEIIHSFQLPFLEGHNEETRGKEHPALSDESLLALSRQMTDDPWKQIGILLGIPFEEITRIWQRDQSWAVFTLLQKWKAVNGGKSGAEKLDALVQAFHDIERMDIAEHIKTASENRKSLRQYLRN